MASRDQWEEYRRTRSIELRNKIVLEYRSFAGMLATRRARLSACTTTVEEWKSVAIEGLIKAVETYDPSRKATFTTWAGHKINGELATWHRDHGRLSNRTLRQFHSRRMAAEESLFLKYERPATASETSSALGMEEAIYNRRLSVYNARMPLSLEEVNYQKVRDSQSLSQIDAEDEIERWLKELCKRDRDIIRRRYAGEKLWDIAKTYGITDTAVSQNLRQSLDTMQAAATAVRERNHETQGCGNADLFGGRAAC